ncbi:MAG: FIST C-terminal domain-containing protein [Gammaproteobacteria bacterium]|nr:FIST C-terminal domain-containing protein [Gammaproteobacteria bacterium]
MTRFALAHAKADSPEAVAAALIARLKQQLEAPGGVDPSRSPLCFLYVTDQLAEHADQLHGLLREATGLSNWLGTVGMGVCATGTEYFDVPAAAVMVTDIPASSFRMFRLEEPATDGIPSSQTCFGIMHGDPRSPDVELGLQRVCESMALGFLVGGLASSRGSYPQFAGGPTRAACSGLLLDDSVAVQTRLTQGCVPIGARHEVTRMEGELLLELDGRSALETFTDEVSGALGSASAANIRSCAYVGLPVAGSDRADYLVRNLVGVEPNRKALAVAHPLSPGDTMFFCRRDRNAAISDLERMLEEVRQASDGRPPKGALYVSCLARGPNLFGPDSEELKTIQSVFGDLPLVGFFANGEISHDRLYGYTGVLTVFL